MKRRIQLRAYDKKTKQIYDVIEWSWDGWVSVRVKIEEDKWELRKLIEDVEILVSTGFKDYYGKIIFTGDVVKWISTYDGDVNFTIIKTLEDFYSMYYLNVFGDDEFDIEESKPKIIGNTWETPALLDIKLNL